MRVVLKIVLSFVVLMIATPISAAAKQVPFMNLIVIAGIVGALIAIWKYNPDKKDQTTEVAKSDDQDKHQLDKS
jgi:uncharacterized membrane protein YeaQ/YmgE (transglycosylase-associated protein family)